MHLLRKEVAHKSVIDNTCSKQCLTLMIEKGFETLFQNEKTDSSMGLKLEMWSAAIESIKANFFFGYDISNRWGAIRTNLAETFSSSAIGSSI